MIVRVKTNFYGQPEFEIERPTLKKVLHELSNRINLTMISPTDDDIHGDFKIYLNEVEVEVLPHGMNTELKEGDRVEVTMVMLSGG